MDKVNEKASVYDYARMCIAESKYCRECPLSGSNTNENLYCTEYLLKHPDKANEIILKWCKEHPVKTRQSEFLKMFPNAVRFENSNIIAIKPCNMDTDYASKPCTLTCEECFKEYWLAEVDENV